MLTPSSKLSSYHLRFLLLITGWIWSSGIPLAQALPPPDDLPEEILRPEIITEGRSPIDGKPLNASQYEELQQKLADNTQPPVVDRKIQNLVFLLKIRKFFKTLFPFL